MKHYSLYTLMLIGSLVSVSSIAQTKETDTLLEEITKMDSLLFEEAFNNCNFAVYKTIMVEGLEFYDDRSGLNNDINKEYAAFKDKCARPFSVTRKLMEHSVHKLGDFGAVQKGTHLFFNNDQLVQSAKFINIWEKTNNSWVIKRAVSYEHKDL